MFWTNKENLETLKLTDVIQHAKTFYPNVNTALHILLSIPYSTATIESQTRKNLAEINNE